MEQPPQQSYDTLTLLDESGKQNFQQNAFIYQIKGRPAFSYGDIWLQNGGRLLANTSTLLWMDGQVQVDTGLAGGCCSAILRNCSGEPCCLNTYIANGENQKVSVGFELPGDMLAFGVTDSSRWVFTYDSFIAGTDNLDISARFSACCACICADTSAFLTTVSIKNGQMGVVLAGSYGMIERHDIPEGQTLLVSRGLFFAAREDINFEVGLIGQECCGLLNLCCTGGGIVFRFRGPGVIYTQSKSTVQLLREFGIPGGKRSNGKRLAAIAIKILIRLIELGVKIAAKK